MIKCPEPLFLREPLEVVDGIPIFSISDRYIENYQQIAADHINAMSADSDNPFIEQDLWKTLEQSTRLLVMKYVRPGAKILDAGVGLGRVLGDLTQYERHGIDITFDYLRNARSKGFSVAFSRIEDMPYEDASFDAVIACDVLEHVIDLESCVKQLLRVLRPGGVLIVRVPYRDDLEVYLNEDLPYEFIHLRSFDVPSLRILFGKIHGMKYIEHGFVAPYFKDCLLKLKLLPSDSVLLGQLSDVRDNDTAHPLWLLKKISKVSHQEFKNWLGALRDNNAEVYNQIAPELLDGLEVNIVFQKAAES